MQTVCRASGGYSERLRFSLVHVHPRYRGTPPPNPSSRHLSYRTSPCPIVSPSANWAITESLTSSCGCFTPGMQWKSLPIPQDAQGKPAIHYTTIYKVFAKWADDGSLWQAFVASVRHLAAEKQLDLTVLHGDGTNTVAKKGAMALATRATNIRRAIRSLPSSTIMATSSRLSLWLRSMRPTWSCYRKARRRSK